MNASKLESGEEGFSILTTHTQNEETWFPPFEWLCNAPTHFDRPKHERNKTWVSNPSQKTNEETRFIAFVRLWNAKETFHLGGHISW